MLRVSISQTPFPILGMGRDGVLNIYPKLKHLRGFLNRYFQNSCQE